MWLIKVFLVLVASRMCELSVMSAAEALSRMVGASGVNRDVAKYAS